MRFPIFLRATDYFEPGASASDVLRLLEPAPAQPLAPAWAPLLKAIPDAGSGRTLRRALRNAMAGKPSHAKITSEQTKYGMRIRAAGGAAMLLELRLYDQPATTYATLDMTLTLDAGLLGILLRPYWQARLTSAAGHWVAWLRRKLRDQSKPDDGDQHTDRDLEEKLARRYPQTFQAFKQMPGGFESLRRVSAMNERWRRLVRGELPRDAVVEVDGALPETEAEFDIIYAGGGLGLVSAAVLAQHYNRRVLIFDRYRPGATHREWNICEWELRQLVRMQLLTEAELERIIAARYRTGIIEFAGTHSRWKQHTLWIDNVLDLAVEADALLTLCAEKICAADNGSRVRGGLSFSRVYIPKGKHRGESNAVVEVIDESGTMHRYGARLVVDAMGAGSPISYALSAGRPYAGVCPTVGTVARGFVEGDGKTEVDPELGEVLITRTGTTNGRQLIWEGFPSGEDRTTVYLFYYNALAPGHTADPGDLLELYEQYFTLLPTYKQPGPSFEHLKPVYGYIPSRARESPREAGATRAARSIIALGDSSAQQSPLTFCGFGSYIRNLDRTTALLDYALRHNLLDAEHLRLIGAQQANVSLNWIFSRFMEPRRNRLARPNEVNEMMNLICTVIDEIGPAFAQRYFKDRTGWTELSLMLLKIMRKYPGIWGRAATTVGIRGMMLWAIDYLAFLREWLLGNAATAIVSRIPSRQAERIAALAERRAPALWMQVEARKYAWHASSGNLEPVTSAIPNAGSGKSW